MINEAEDLNTLSKNVLELYGIKPQEVTLVQGGSIKTVWKVKNQGKFYCLKRLKQTVDKAEFSVNAQIYIKNHGGKVPTVVCNTDNKNITEFEGQLFVLYEWIDGKDLNFLNPADLCDAVSGLAAFHKASKGYIPPQDSRVSSKLSKWTEQYNSMINKFKEWKADSKKNLEHPSYAEYIKQTDSMIELAESAVELLNKSDYGLLTKENTNSVVLCHQDFGKGNAISASSGVYIIDLDGVTFDLPARDLRKIIGKLSENKGRWEAETIAEVVECYEKVNSIGINGRNVLYIDLLFPHWFYGLVKNQYKNGKVISASEIEKISKLEQSKKDILISLIK